MNTNMNDGFVQTPNGKFIIKSTFKKKNISKKKSLHQNYLKTQFILLLKILFSKIVKSSKIF